MEGAHPALPRGGSCPPDRRHHRHGAARLTVRARHLQRRVVRFCRALLVLEAVQVHAQLQTHLCDAPPPAARRAIRGLQRWPVGYLAITFRVDSIHMLYYEL